MPNKYTAAFICFSLFLVMLFGCFETAVAQESINDIISIIDTDEEITRGDFLSTVCIVVGATPELNDMLKIAIIEKPMFNDALGTGEKDGFFSIAKWEGLVKGEVTENGAVLLLPDRAVTNIEALTMILRCVDEEVRNYDSVDHWEQKSMQKAKEYGIVIKGDMNDTLSYDGMNLLLEFLLEQKPGLYFGAPYYFYYGNGIDDYTQYTYSDLLKRQRQCAR